MIRNISPSDVMCDKNSKVVKFMKFSALLMLLLLVLVMVTGLGFMF